MKSRRLELRSVVRFHELAWLGPENQEPPCSTGLESVPSMAGEADSSAPSMINRSNGSRHHSSTLPIMSCRPQALGSKDPTGASREKPSSKGNATLVFGKRATLEASATLAKPEPPAGSRPQGKSVAEPARQANSHWASVGSARPKCSQNARASFQLTCVTGCSGSDGNSGK